MLGIRSGVTAQFDLLAEAGERVVTVLIAC